MFFASVWLGVFLGGKSAQVVCTHLLKTTEGFTQRLSIAFGAFGFLFLPVLVGLFTNANMGTDIGMHSLGAHFLWACVGAGFFFYISSENTEDNN